MGDGGRLVIPHQRYTRLDELGSGGQGTSYLAEDTETGDRVVVKRLAVEALEDWKSIELFERAIEVLERLDHPAIPAYVDAFDGSEFGEATGGLYFVREFVAGESLQDAVDAGERMTEAEVREVADELFDILVYLHGRDPPVVHRDIKPGNIIRRPNGSLALVDFGAVQEKVLDESGGSTVVGTAGYVPPEQLGGQASPASDLYAVGATLVHLLTHKRPSDLPVERMTIQFRGHADISEAFAEFLDRLLAPNPADRFASAETARRALHGEEPGPDASDADGGVPAGTELLPPDGSDLTVERDDNELRIVFPPETPRSHNVITAGIILGVPAWWAIVVPHMWVTGLAVTLVVACVVLLARHFLEPDSVDIVVDDTSVRVREIGGDGKPTATLYRRPHSAFPGLADTPFKLVQRDQSNSFTFGSTHEHVWVVTQSKQAGEQFSFRDADYFLTIPPDDKPVETLEDLEAPLLPHVFIEPGGNLSLGERRWIIQAVDEAVERRSADDSDF